MCPGHVAILPALQTGCWRSCLPANPAVHLVQVCDAHKRLQQIQLTELLMDSAPLCEFDMVQPPGGEPEHCSSWWMLVLHRQYCSKHECSGMTGITTRRRLIANTLQDQVEPALPKKGMG